MDKKCQLSVGEFLMIRRELKDLGYQQIEYRDFAEEFKRLNLTAPRKINGREAGFLIHIKGFTVVVWTTFDLKNMEFRDTGKDAGWVLIRKGDKVRYFSGPIHRTKSFSKRLLSYAWICKFRIKHMPLCPICKHRMDITTGKKNPKSKYLHCPNYKKHEDGKPKHLSWDFMLDKEKMPVTYRFLEERRKNRASQRNKMEREGKETDSKMKKRKKWKVSNTDNLE